MINPCTLVIGLCGINLLLIAAEMYHLSVDPYLSHPFFDVFLPVNSFVFRITCPGEFPSVAIVLRLRCRTEICLSIVKSFVIYMVDE